jgi:hypothetical protein
MSAEQDLPWWHCYPVNDSKKHITSAFDGVDVMSCPCNPTFDAEQNVIIHNSFDGREKYETGQRIPH